MNNTESSLKKHRTMIILLFGLFIADVTSAFHSPFQLKLQKNTMVKEYLLHHIDQNFKFQSHPKRNRIVDLNRRQSQSITTKRMLTNQMSYNNLDELTSSIDIASTEASQSFPSSFWINAVETFDGSEIVNPVIVSNVFWVGLKSKILSILIGQFLATIAFALLTNFISNNAMKIAEDVIAKKLSFLDSVSFGDLDYSRIGANQRTEQKQAQSMQDKRPQTQGLNPSINIDINKLVLCLIIDTLGTSSEFIPFVGELTDIGYAPIAALALRYIFTGSNIVFALEFVEEILPFTDILPLATICWTIETFYGGSDLARFLQIGSFGSDGISFDEQDESNVNKRNQINDDSVIDVPFKRNDDTRYSK